MDGAEPNCSTTVFETEEYERVGIVRAVIAGISILTCSGALFLIVIMKRWQAFSQVLIIYLLVSALLASMAAFIDIDFNHSRSLFDHRFCKFSGYFTQTTALMLVAAIFAITIYLFFLIVREHNTGNFGKLYFIGIFVAPFLISWIPFVKDGYGKSGVWCWIRTVDHKTCEKIPLSMYLQYILYFIPIYFLLSVGTLLYVIMFVGISRRQRRARYVTSHEETRAKLKMMKNELLSLVAYPVIFGLLTIPAIVNRIYSTMYPNDPSLVLWYLSGIFGPLTGTFTAIAFTLGTKIWQGISRFNVRAALWNKDVVQYYSVGQDAESDSKTSSTRYSTIIIRS